nr:AI-2E family transporter [Propioniciclava soli]
MLIVLIGWAVRMVAEAGSLLSSILVPTALSILFAGLLMPLQVLFNHRLRLPRSLAAALTVLVAIGAVAALLWVSGAQLAAGMDDIVGVFQGQLEDLRGWVVSTLPIGREQLNEAINQAQQWLTDNQASLAQGALGYGVTAAQVVIAGILALVATFFFLAQGDRIASGLLTLLPKDHRRRLWEAGRRGWVTLSTYCRTQVIVAAVDAIGIGAGAFFMGLPFVVPIMVITFVLCFIPFVGAIVSGAIAVLIALAFKGITAALVILAICVAVQQIESNVLAPLLMGKAVNVHPLLILLSVAGATYIFGLVGALFMVPVIATIKSIVLYLNDLDPFPMLAEGGSALTDSPKKLMGDQAEIKNPPRLGDASPTWLAEEAEAEADAAEQAAQDHASPGGAGTPDRPGGERLQAPSS